MAQRAPMNRRTFLLTASAAGIFGASPAKADFVDAVRQELRAQGYSRISVTSTLLGRSKIVAQGKSGTREIILNPRTGEVLRDLWTSAQGGTVPSIIGGSGPASNSGDDDGDDDGGGKGRGRGRGGDDGDRGGDDGGRGGDGDSGGGHGGGDGDSGGGDD